ncbi:hypothetical protein LTR08_001531 [Meristemomyces frigidus]|nr:hypothetical protein LTR08_001531 [Meristemomyces frigidus]
MADKRKREDDKPAVDYRPGNKKQKQKQKGGFQNGPANLSEKPKPKVGFRVGPANLPDGTYRRKTQKIKESLIERAQIKKTYAKLKKQSNISDEPESLPQPASLALDAQQQQEPQEPVVEPEANTAPHPDRQTLIDKGPALEPPAPAKTQTFYEPRPRKERKPKPQPFAREHQDALARKAEAEERRTAREAAEREREAKIAERERFRRAMAKARTGGPGGQRKLGRESQVLLERVQRMVGAGR